MLENNTYKYVLKRDWIYISLAWCFLMTGFIGVLYFAPGYLQQLRSKDPEQYGTLALQYFNEKKYDQAIENLKIGLYLSPNDPGLNFLLGRIYEEKKDFTNAEKYLVNAFSNDSKNIEYLNVLAGHYVRSNQWEKAEQLCESQIVQGTNNFSTLSQMAFIYERINEPYKAIEIYQTIYSKNPQFLEAIKGLARVYSHINKQNNALKYLEKAVLINPEDTILWRDIGEIYQSQKNFPKAEYSYLKAYNLNKDNYYNNMSLVWLYFNYEKPNKVILAETYLSNATTISPEQYEPYYRLGIIERDLKKSPERAIKLFKKAIFLNPKDKYFYLDLGIAYEMINHPDEALTAYKRALSIDPSFPVKDRINRLSKS